MLCGSPYDRRDRSPVFVLVRGLGERTWWPLGGRLNVLRNQISGLEEYGGRSLFAPRPLPAFMPSLPHRSDFIVSVPTRAVGGLWSRDRGIEGSSSSGHPHTEVHILSQHNQIRLLRQLTGSDVNASGMPVVHVPALLKWTLSLGVGRRGCGDGLA